MVTLADIQKNEDIKALISAGNRYLAAMGFTEHGPRHVSYVSRTAAGILAALNFSPREVELAAIAGGCMTWATPSIGMTTGRWARCCCCLSCARQAWQWTT